MPNKYRTEKTVAVRNGESENDTKRESAKERGRKFCFVNICVYETVNKVTLRKMTHKKSKCK